MVTVPESHVAIVGHRLNFKYFFSIRVRVR